MSRLALSAEEMAGLSRRHPALMTPPLAGRLVGPAVLAGVLAPFLFGLWWLGASPIRILGGLKALVDFLPLMIPPDPEGHAMLFADALWQTLAIALLGTMASSFLAFPFAFLAARNVVPNLVVHHLARRLLDIVRSIDVLVWALIWIGVVGLGPFAGVLAIATSDFGALGKLFSETVETTGNRAREGVRASGGSRIDEIRLGLVPQVLPVIAGQALYFFESNVRSATIIGIVGAGGIGLHLYEAIRTLEWREVSYIVLTVLVAVAVIDAVSSRLRRGMRAG